jgi:GNAT superfamily N-acetyltransferase
VLATILTARERPDLAERARELTADVWPEYNAHGVVPLRYWPGLYEVFPEFQYVLYDEDGDDVAAEGHSLPLLWDGTAAGLPAGIDGAMAAAFDLQEAGGEANTLCAMAIEIPPRHQRQGLSRTMIAAMTRVAANHGFGDLIAPVRPSAKERYPLTPIERYASWMREDGLPFDPWMRVHVRVGGEILRPEPKSLYIEGSVGEWEAWTEMAFPESGDYVFPRGLAPLTIDRPRDVGRYWEPNVWMRHRVAS